ncbi:MAG TPA: glutamine amidotransferase, partial [Verrucomicrobiota bacterium]|nr:glutamine amidotransferase [Verrucomicrobiota bacterium]
TVLIAGHAGPDTMIQMADQGRGRFYNVSSAYDLPQIFIKETAVILKSAIYEEPFKPQLRSSSEVVRGIGAEEYPPLLGYVATTPKARAETPLWTDKGDPLLAHWQYGLGRAVAFTSDAKARWGRNWLNWERYRQFWSQVGQWSLRRLDSAEFSTEVTVDKGEAILTVDALDEQGNYRNFLNLQAAIVNPKGERQTVRIEQTGPGHYEARFPTAEVGAYLLNIMDIKDGQLRGTQVVGASVNYSPEFNTAEPNLNLLRRLAESGGGKLLDRANLAINSFSHDRQKTFQPQQLWEGLLKLAILLFVADVAVRRVQVDRAEWLRWMAALRRRLFFWETAPRPVEADESLAALLARRQQVRSSTTPAIEPRPDLFQPQQPPVVGEPAPGPATVPAATAVVPPPESAPEPPPAPAPGGTTSRLLEAKRRAQQRRRK